MIYKKDIVAIVGFFIIIGIFFSPTILQGKLPVPSDSLVGLYHPWRDFYSSEYSRGIPFKNFLITDPVRQQIPWRKIAIDQWKEGKVPFWNPYNFSGAPLLANIQAAALYPLNILFFFFPFIDAWAVLIILQPLLAGLFMYWYLRSLDLEPIPCLLGAVAWSFSGFNVAWMTWGTIGHVALWLPLTLLAIDKSRSFIVVFSLVSQFFAGHAQISLYFILVVIAYAVMRKRVGFMFVFLLSLVAFLTAVQWVPLLDWIRQSARVIDGSTWSKEGWFIPWAHLVQFVAPDFFGNPTTLNYWGQWNYGEFVGYIGMLPLIFAFSAIFLGRGSTRLFWIGAGVIALLFALATPIAYLPFILNVPMLSSIQPTRLLFVVDFALAVLAAFGCNEFIEYGKKRRERIPLVFIGVVFAILWIVSLRLSLDVSRRNLILPTTLYIVSAVLLTARLTKYKNFAALGIVGLVAFDLLRFGLKFIPFTPREYLFPETKVIAFLKQQPKPFRVMSVDKRILPPNTASFYGIESIEGYDPIISSRYEELMAVIARGKPDITPPFGFNRIVTLDSATSPFLSMFGVRYILSLSNLEEPHLKKVFEEGETKVYEDSRAPPRIYVVERPIVAFGKEKAIEALYAVKDVRREAVVEGNVSILSVPVGSDEAVLLTRYESNRLEIETKLSVPRLLVVANAYHPRWRAAIDGNASTTYRTNYAFQGVVVPEGTHKVVFSFVL